MREYGVGVQGFVFDSMFHFIKEKLSLVPLLKVSPPLIM